MIVTSLTRGLACLRRQQSETTSEVHSAESHVQVITPYTWVQYLYTALTQIRLEELPFSRNVRSKFKCSAIVQFTLINVVCYVLHRPVSQVIRR